MSEVPEGFWSRSLALITMCVVIGAVIGAIGGLLTDNVGRGIAVGIAVGSASSIVLLLKASGSFDGDR
ncbi:MAG: hypothetical protein Q7T55_11235 [Solirubrobacteraceae bacterium]|nr:hypothetical protein [Solirubrobacteraceae bacterium]